MQPEEITDEGSGDGGTISGPRTEHPEATDNADGDSFVVSGGGVAVPGPED